MTVSTGRGRLCLLWEKTTKMKTTMILEQAKRTSIRSAHKHNFSIIAIFANLLMSLLLFSSGSNVRTCWCRFLWKPHSAQRKSLTKNQRKPMKFLGVTERKLYYTRWGAIDLTFSHNNDFTARKKSFKNVAFVTKCWTFVIRGNYSRQRGAVRKLVQASIF